MHYTNLIVTCERQTFSAASWSSSVRSSAATSDVKGKLKDWMLVSTGFFIVTIAQSFASDNCVCHHNMSLLDIPPQNHERLVMPPG